MSETSNHEMRIRHNTIYSGCGHPILTGFKDYCPRCRISELEAINKALWKDHWEGEDMIDELEAKLERVRELPEYAVQTGGWGGWEIVPAEGFEAQTFVDKDQLDAALKETDNE